MVLLACLTLAGCVTLPEILHPKPELPAAWPGQTAAAELTPTWWKAFHDPALDALMDEALAHNQDLKLAAARVLESEAALQTVTGAHQPYVAASASTSHNRRSQAGSTVIAGSPIYNSHALGIEASYEVDLWGRLAAGASAARADLLSSRDAREVVRLTLTHNLAQAWFTLLALDAKEKLAQDTLANREAAVALIAKRQQAGMTSELELRQAEAEAAALQSALAQLTGQVRQQENAVAILLGRSPRALVEGRLGRSAALGALAPPEIPAGLPSQLLQRRPDLKQAEAALVAAQARIKETGEAIWPSLSLTGSLGSESKSLSDLFSGRAMVWSLGAALTQTLFNGGRTEAALQAVSARQEQAAAQYESAVRQAFREVLDALAAHRQARETLAAETRRSAALAEAARLANRRFEAGSVGRMEALDAERSQFQAEAARIDAQRARLAAAASLSRALGGGWTRAE
ncbi:MAG: efflux transporter outer membrane subunit [Betaproteobacteria bacterium]|nr:efflux transporter outer membrane subunit [Betaproteobacteria bacterium]